MKLNEMRQILYSPRGDIQMAVIYECETNTDLDAGSVDYIVKVYGDYEVTRIQAYNNELVFYV